MSAHCQEYGIWNVHYADFPVLLSYPKSRRLTLQPREGGPLIELAHGEDHAKGDRYSFDKGVADLFLAYSPSGSVTAEVVYANYGRTEDFEVLKKLGVDCIGKIVITRYGKIFRGDKVQWPSTVLVVGVKEIDWL